MSDKNLIPFERVTQEILAALDAGVVPWRKPWKGAANAPRSVDGRPYSGINPFILMLREFDDPRFLTYKRATELGGTIRKGEKSTPVVFWKQIIKPRLDDAGQPVLGKDGKPQMRRIPFIQWFNVFNVEQAEGIEFPALVTVPDIEPTEVDARIEALLAAMPNRPEMRHVTGDRAYYTPATDVITLPKRNQFESVIGYAETIFHEHGHSTGHKSRLNREGIETFDHFGSDRYAREELVAEFCAAFLAGEVGIERAEIGNLVSYIANWRQRFVEDPKLLVVAAGRGQRAANYILGLVEQEQEAKAA